MAVSSVDALIQYFEAFEQKRAAGQHDLKIATIFTYAANPDDPKADGLLPETTFPDVVAPQDTPKRDKLVEYVGLYNQTYGANETVADGKVFYTYYRALAKRVTDKRYSRRAGAGRGWGSAYVVVGSGCVRRPASARSAVQDGVRTPSAVVHVRHRTALPHGGG